MDRGADLVVGSTWKPSPTEKPATLLAFVSSSHLIFAGLNVYPDGLSLGQQRMALLSFLHL